MAVHICQLSASQILSDFQLSSGNMPVFPDESAPIVRFVRKIRHFPGQKTVLLLSHDVNGLPVSLTSYANFVVNEFFSVTVVNEMQVLLTTHESTNFSNLLFLLIRTKTVVPDIFINNWQHYHRLG